MNKQKGSFIIAAYLLLLYLFIGRAPVAALTASDSFNRANQSPIAGNWTTGYFAPATVSLVSNQIIVPSGTDTGAYWNASTFGNDQFSQAKITTTTAQDNHAVAVRMSTSTKTYYYCDAGQIHEIGKFINGALTHLKTVSVTINTNDVIRCEVQGTTIRYIVNQITIGSVADSSLTSGKVGVFLSTTNGTMDDWSGGDLAGGAPDTTPPTISSIALSNVTPTGATASWATNETSDTQVNYGTTATYGSTVFSNAMVMSHSSALTGLASGTTYHYQVKSKDAAGNMAASADNTFATASPPPPDTTPPSAPSSLQASNITSNSINLSWVASTDNVAVAGYRVYRNSSQVATTSSTSNTDANLSASTTYTYTVTAYDSAGNVSAQSSPVSATTANQSASIFPVRYSANRHYLVDQNNTPVPILGRTAWFVISLPVADYQTFITDSVSRGYNSIEMHVIDHDARGNNPPFGGNGTAPFLKRLDGSNWNGTLGGSAPDFSTPNEAYWSFVDTFLNYCQSQGVLVFMFPAYTGYAGGGQGWMQEMTANGTSKLNSYGAYLSNRYKNQGNLVWMMGGDFGTGSLPFNQAQTDVENALYAGLTNVGQQSIYFSAEWVRGSIATDQTAFGTRMTLNGVYTNSQGINDYGRRAYSYSPTEPAYLLEEPYDQEGTDGNRYNLDATQPVRRFQWWGWLSTIGGYISGNGYVWPFVSPAWRNHLDTQGSRDMGRLNAFIKSISWSELVPSGLSGMKTLVTSGGGGLTQGDYVAAAASPTGSLLVAYIPPGHSGSITVDMTAMGAAAQARWFDPTTGNYSTISGSPFPNTGTRQFVPPGNNGSGMGDWALILDTSFVSDTVAPSTPANLSAVAVSSSQINLSWSASSDNVGVTGYRVYRGGVQVGTSTTVNYSNTGLSTSSTYTFTVAAYDARGNVSAESASASATTQAPDTAPPSIPSNLQASNVTGNSATITWTGSVDNVAVAGYQVFKDGSLVTTTAQTSYVSTGLTLLTSYSFTVAAYDSSNNVSGLSQPLNVTTTNATSVATPAFIKLTEAKVTASSNSVATPGFSSAITSGNLIAVWTWYNSNSQSVSSITDSRGNIYVRAVGPTTGTGAISGWRQELWYAKNITGGSGVSVTATFTGAFSTEKSITAHEYSGLDLVSPLDSTGAAVTSSANASTSASTNFANGLIFATAFFQGNGVAASGLVQRSSIASNVSADKNGSAPGSYAVSFANNSQSAIIQVATFKASGQ